MQIAAINNFGTGPNGVERFKIPNGNGLCFEHHMFFFSLTGHLLQYSPFKRVLLVKGWMNLSTHPKNLNLYLD